MSSSRPASTSTRPASTSTRPASTSTRPASTSTRPAHSPNPRPAPYQVNTQTKLIDTVHGRILCIADIRGRLSALNDLAREANAKAIIHTGDFGLFEASSIERIHDRTLRHLTMYSPLIPSAQRNYLLSPEHPPQVIRQTLTISMLSEFPLLLAGQIKLQVPVFTVAGACEDVLVLERFRSGDIDIPNLHLLDEATTRVLDIGGVKLRLLGLGGAFVPHKMFDNGDGNATIGGGGGTVWTTALQIGELVDTAQRVHDPTETRLLVTHASPGREGILASLALVVKADLTISAGLHFRYASSWNEFSVLGDFDGFRQKLRAGKDAFDRVWESVKTQVDAVIDDHQRVLLDKALAVIERVPPPLGQAPTAGGAPAVEEPAWKNCWNWNLCDAAYGSLVLDVKEGRVSAELKSQGFNYAYRRTATPGTASTPTATAPPPATATPGATFTKASTPAPPQKPTTGPSTPPPEASGTQSPVKVNGSGPSSNNAPTPEKERSEKEREKFERDKAKKKEKKKEKKEREAREKEQAAEGDKDKEDGAEGKVTPPAMEKEEKPTLQVQPALPTDSPKTAEDGLMSPRTDSTGARTPTTKRPPRNPWTIFVRLPVPANETELRDFFGEAKSGITRVNFPSSFSGRERKIAYVEFGDEDAMKAGLEKHAEKLNDGVPDVKQADQPREHGGYRGPGGKPNGDA
ncbi:hypothetical protein OF83DRAFT_394789 [Amylostereum chailletii]|nr:hypothetical protein OF83DRAFT_394789 [Amylostereum chailletii]